MEFVFGEHFFDVARRELRRNGDLVALEPQVCDLLIYLIQNRDRVVSKNDIFEAVWGGRIVSESALTTRINAVRKAVGDSGAAQLLTRTFSRKGVRFVGEVRETQHAADTRLPSAAPPEKPPDPLAPSANLRPLSIIILPFLNLSQDAAEEHFLDGIVDSLISDLSRVLPGSFVISRSTAFTYKGRQVQIRNIGQELGVRYVLEGSVLLDPGRVRVNVQLIDAQTDEHVWAERFDKERKDVLEVQDEIVARLSRSVGIEMVRTEAARTSPSGGGQDAIDLVMRARALVNAAGLRENVARAVTLFREALKLDPHNVDALVGIATVCIYQVVNLFSVEVRDLLDEAETSICRAMMLAPDHIGVLKARAILLRARGRFADSVIANENVISRSPGDPFAYKEIGLNKLYLGATMQAIEWFRRADRIAPSDPDRWIWLQGLGRALMQLGRDEEAVGVLHLAMESNPRYVRGKAWLAAAEALAGDIERAGRYLAEYLQAEPEMTVRRFAAERSSVPPDATSPAYQRENERILYGLRRAGMPDQ